MIRVLVTGFGPFPKAPVNPTEALMRRLAARPPQLGRGVRVATAVIPTEYAGLAGELARLGSREKPDVAIHFGLAMKAKGFRLEARARNATATNRVDAAGNKPPSAEIAAGEADRFSNLPLDAIAVSLVGSGLPMQRSDDCGTYLCNALFFHSAAGLVPNFRPAMRGFIHVPMPQPRASIDEDALERGASLVIAESVAAYRTWAAQPVNALANLGPASATALGRCGIATAGDLGRVGAVEAYRRWRAEAAPARVSRTALWALIGALDGRPFTALTAAEKARWTRDLSAGA